MMQVSAILIGYLRIKISGCTRHGNPLPEIEIRVFLVIADTCHGVPVERSRPVYERVRILSDDYFNKIF